MRHETRNNVGVRQPKHLTLGAAASKKTTGLIPHDYLEFQFPRLEELFAEFCHDRGTIFLAAEDIQVGGVRFVGKVTGDQRCLYQLGHRIPGDATIRSEMDDLRFSKAFHINEITQFNDELTDFICIANGLGVTPLEVDTGVKPPCLPLSEVLYDIGVRYCVTHGSHLGDVLKLYSNIQRILKI